MKIEWHPSLACLVQLASHLPKHDTTAGQVVLLECTLCRKGPYASFITLLPFAFSLATKGYWTTTHPESQLHTYAYWCNSTGLGLVGASKRKSQLHHASK